MVGRGVLALSACTAKCRDTFAAARESVEWFGHRCDRDRHTTAWLQLWRIRATRPGMELGRSKLFHAVILAGLSLGSAACGAEAGGSGVSSGGAAGAGGVSSGGTGGGAAGGAGGSAPGGGGGASGGGGAASGGAAGASGSGGAAGGAAVDAGSDAHDMDAGADAEDGWAPTK